MSMKSNKKKKTIEDLEFELRQQKLVFTQFLYELMLNHLPVGRVEDILEKVLEDRASMSAIYIGELHDIAEGIVEAL